MSGHRHSTDRVDGLLIAKCPSKQHQDDAHLAAIVEYGDAVDNDLYETFVEAFGECRACGAELDVIVREEQTEVLT